MFIMTIGFHQYIFFTSSINAFIKVHNNIRNAVYTNVFSLQVL